MRASVGRRLVFEGEEQVQILWLRKALGGGVKPVPKLGYEFLSSWGCGLVPTQSKPKAF